MSHTVAPVVTKPRKGAPIVLHPLVLPQTLDARGRRVRCWCGPSALAIVSGLSYDEAHALMCDVLRKKRIMGTFPAQMRAAFRRAGWIMGENALEGGTPRTRESFGLRRLGLADTLLPPAAPTLAMWSAGRSIGQMLTTFLVLAGRHWIVVKSTRMADNHTKAVVPLDACPHLRKRVAATFPLTRW